MRIPFFDLTTAKVNIYIWHNWFAWFPVIIHDQDKTKLVWLETVIRRWVTTSTEDGYYAYALPEQWKEVTGHE